MSSLRSIIINYITGPAVLNTKRYAGEYYIKNENYLIHPSELKSHIFKLFNDNKYDYVRKFGMVIGDFITMKGNKYPHRWDGTNFVPEEVNYMFKVPYFPIDYWSEIVGIEDINGINDFFDTNLLPGVVVPRRVNDTWFQIIVRINLQNWYILIDTYDEGDALQTYQNWKDGDGSFESLEKATTLHSLDQKNLDFLDRYDKRRLIIIRTNEYISEQESEGDDN